MTAIVSTKPIGPQAHCFKFILTGRLGRPEEVADAVLFFAGPGAAYVAGQVLSVSGGLTMAG